MRTLLFSCPLKDQIHMKSQLHSIIKIIILIIILSPVTIQAQEHSVARKWNDVLLEGIRNDFARPTIHSRNLYHTSIGMYDAWAAYDPSIETFLLGKTLYGYSCPYTPITLPADIEAAREEAISYASYRLLKHRFLNSPDETDTYIALDALMDSLGYDKTFVSTDYTNDGSRALGNYIAESLINYGLQDQSNEQGSYNNQFYAPINDPLVTDLPGNPDISDPNRWQPLTLDIFIDQSGNVIPFNTPDFLSPEWGAVDPFALKSEDMTTYSRNGDDYLVYHDPGMPPLLDTMQVDSSDNYKWGFALVSAWSSHLDPADGVMWDISPASIGNIQSYPTSFDDYDTFYDLENGGDASIGHTMNPVTGQPYTPQLVPRADYARVLAEFWADGPDSETPPGHWFTLLNYVGDHPLFEKRYRGTGDIINDLEWDVKSYFIMGGAMHDSAVTAWGIKGWYDYLRPISAIRCMGDLGQSSDVNLPSYHAGGLPLISGYIELIETGDPLAGANDENVDKIKVYAWKGPDYITNPASSIAGVDWILAENWWPYQRPSFVTPPFAGYISGHSTFSSAAAKVMETITGDAFFPGGIGEFNAIQNQFLVFEDGPSVDVVLQWATYKDASDQTSLSRIWGGIHPPADDIPGRFIGEDIGTDAINYAESFFLTDNDMDGVYAEEDCDDNDPNVGATPCPIDINPMVEMTAATTALFTWNAAPDATFYQVKYRLKGTTAWLTLGTANTQRSISNLSEKKYYQYKIRAQYADSSWSAFTDIGLFYTSMCDVPTGIASIYLDNTRMKIRWDSNPNEIKAKVRYREVGTTTWTTQNSQSGNNYIYINGLAPDATYEYRLRSNCDGNDWSAYSDLYTHDLNNPIPRLTTTANNVKIYPNPTKDIIQIEFSTTDNEKVSISISDQLGRVIYSQNNTYQKGIQVENVDLSGFSNGYYFVSVYGRNGVNVEKIVKMR
jgi:hypothetical protein